MIVPDATYVLVVSLPVTAYVGYAYSLAGSEFMKMCFYHLFETLTLSILVGTMFIKSIPFNSGDNIPLI